MTRQLAPCGTNAAYQRHISNGEQPCADCRAARAAYGRWYKNPDADTRRRRALNELARRHPQEFRELLNEQVLK